MHNYASFCTLALLFPFCFGGLMGGIGWGLDEFFFLSLSLFLYKGEKYQLTKDKKWTVNTLNKAQQEQELAFTLYLSLPPPSSIPSTFHKGKAQSLQSAN